MTTVVAAVIEKNGQILICRRKLGQAHELKWEFPGGKLEPGETPPQALKRELNEELAIDATIGFEFMRHEFAYPEKPPILLIFFEVTEFEGEPVNRIFEEIRWEDARRLPDYDFLEGDIGFVRSLAAKTGSVPSPRR
jgi:8-oxo-dGTP diphosphatase